MDPLEYLDVARQAAQKAGALLAEKLGKVSVREKHPADLVTEADEASQKMIEEILLTAYPDHAFIGEEAIGNHLSEQECGKNAPADRPFTWIVDPLDGTTNFVHQVPHFGPSIALARGSELICGVVYNPITKECFTAAKGKGAWLNDRPIRVSQVQTSEKALISFSFPTTVNDQAPDMITFIKLAPHVQAMRRTGSTALNLAYIASGRFDAQYNHATHAWDVAAGVLLVQEAGGVITGSTGKPFDLSSPPFLAAATPELHKNMLKYL
ncbi:MAG: inositol monophosphatase family protein [Planctomycetia bacterium]|nr:inositol monophosphatase family protein [Planctomycetia bacterium]